KAGRHTFPDKEGEEFADEAGARAHADAVARELMRNREARTSHWSVEVCDDYLRPCYECLFAEVDEKLEGFGAQVRVPVTAVARTTAAMNDALRNIESGWPTCSKRSIESISYCPAGRPV